MEQWHAAIEGTSCDGAHRPPWSRQLQIEVEVVDDRMTGTTLPRPDGREGEASTMWSFTATKQ